MGVWVWVGVCNDGLGDSGVPVCVWVWVGVRDDGLGDSGYQCVGVGGSV